MIHTYRSKQDTAYKPQAIGVVNVLAYLDKIYQKGIKETSPLEIFIHTQKRIPTSELPIEHTLTEIKKEYNIDPEFKKIIKELEETDVLKPEGNRYPINRYHINTDNLEKAIEYHKNKISLLSIFDLAAECQGKEFTS